MREMNRIGAVLTIGVLLLTTGCAGRELTTTEQTTVGGALLGAGTGAIVGSATGKAGAGTAIGAGVGALSGMLVGQAIEAEAAKQRRIAEQERYRQQQLGTFGGTTGSTVGGPPLSSQQQAQTDLERQRQRQLEVELQRQREQQRRLEEELAQLKAERQGGTVTIPPPASSDLSTRIAKLTPTEKRERLRDVEQKIADLKEELDLAKRIDSLELQRELEQQIRELEEERAELERQLAFTR